MEIKVIKDTDLERFVSFINELLKKGWEPLGGVAPCGNNAWGSQIYFIQTLVKK